MSVCTMGLPKVHLPYGDASPGLLAATERKGTSPSSACCQCLSACPGWEHCPHAGVSGVLSVRGEPRVSRGSTSSVQGDGS